MGTQTTINITRNEAISRIMKIADLVSFRKYNEIKSITFETDLDIELFVANFERHVFYNIENFTNKQLEHFMDRPFIRRSMFCNYHVMNN